MPEPYPITSESVAEGHPDKVADQISDAVLDAMLEQDEYSRVACETLVARGMVLVAGEITSKAQVDVAELARKVVLDVGYTDASCGLDGNTCAVLTALGKQSQEIASGVDCGGAGDQGMMFGYATRETKELMPLPIVLAHRITRRLADVRREGILPYLLPDGKSQVTVEYHDGRPQRVTTVVVAAQHSQEAELESLRRDVEEKVVLPVIPPEYLESGKPVFHINCSGNFHIGGPQADCGLTGRKIIVDTYGGVGRHGGGAFSGKDPTKVDRSGAYMARHVAKCVVAAGLAERCEVHLAYVIGEAEPVSVRVVTGGETKVSNAEISRLVRQVFNLTPQGIIDTLQLRRPIYRRTASYGHFGRSEEGFTWEDVKPASELKSAAASL